MCEDTLFLVGAASWGEDVAAHLHFVKFRVHAVGVGGVARACVADVHLVLLLHLLPLVRHQCRHLRPRSVHPRLLLRHPSPSHLISLLIHLPQTDVADRSVSQSIGAPPPPHWRGQQRALRMKHRHTLKLLRKRAEAWGLLDPLLLLQHTPCGAHGDRRGYRTPCKDDIRHKISQFLQTFNTNPARRGEQCCGVEWSVDAQ